MRWAACAMVALLLPGCASSDHDAAEVGGDGTVEPPRTLSEDAEAAHVRPGLGIASPANGTTSLTHGHSCTAGFITRSATNGTFYLATAGHCVAAYSLGDQVGIGYAGMEVKQRGRLVYASFLADPMDQGSCGNGVQFSDGRSCFNDLALVEIAPQSLSDTNASLPTWGGPVPGEAEPTLGGLVHTVGASGYRGGTSLPDARSGVVMEVRQWSLMVQFTTTTPGGDSGSPVLDSEGRALGLVIARGPNVSPDPVVGVTYVGLLRPMLEAAAGHGWPVEVVPGGSFTALPSRSP